MVFKIWGNYEQKFFAHHCPIFQKSCGKEGGENGSSKAFKSKRKKNRPKHTALLEKHLEKLLKLSTQMSLM